MKLFNKTRGTMDVVPNIEVNTDTVYIRSNIVKIETADFTGWEYDEIQYGKDEYTELLNSNQIVLQTDQKYQTDRLTQMEADNQAFQDFIVSTLPQ